MRLLTLSYPPYLIVLIEHLRVKLRDGNFLVRHRVHSVDFTRDRQLTFPLLMLFILQQTVKSIQRHLHEFLDELAGGQLFEPLTSGAVTHARAKLKESAFIELNTDCVLPTVYRSERPVRRWREHRLVGVDSSLIRLPDSAELGQVFGWKKAVNQHGAAGTRYPEGRLSVLYDLLNRIGWDARLEPSTVSEVPLAREQLSGLQPNDVVIHDRGFTGYLFLAAIFARQAHFIARCSNSSFLMANQLFRLNRANQSPVVWLYASGAQKAECQRLGLPLKLQVRFVSLRLPTGELEVLATSLLDEVLYPTLEFLTVYHWRWGHETFHLMLKSRLELERFSGRTLEAVRQDVQAALLLANLESVLTQPAQSALDHQPADHQARQVNRANAYHALKDQLLELLYQDIPAPIVLAQLTELFKASPVAIRPTRKKTDRRRPSLHRSNNFQKRLKKMVF